MDCDKFEIDRMSMLNEIEQSVTEVTKNILFNLQDNVLFNIFLGIDFEIDDEDLYILRKVSVYHINKMYAKRRSLETPVTLYICSYNHFAYSVTYLYLPNITFVLVPVDVQ